MPKIISGPDDALMLGKRLMKPYIMINWYIFHLGNLPVSVCSVVVWCVKLFFREHLCRVYTFLFISTLRLKSLIF